MCFDFFFELQKQSMARHVCHSHFSKISRHVIFVLAERNEILILELKISPSEANTTIFVLYILDIDSHCPYLLSGETTLGKFPIYIYDLEKPPPI